MDDLQLTFMDPYEEEEQEPEEARPARADWYTVRDGCKVNLVPVGDLRAVLRASQKPKARPVPCWHCDNFPSNDVHHLDGNHGNNRPDNLAPYCKRCHNEVHGIDDNLTDLGLTVRQYYGIQRQRIAMSNRIGAYLRLGYQPEHAQTIYKMLSQLEKETMKLLAEMVKHEPIYQAYLSHIKGIGPALSSVLICEIYDPGRFGTISSLWAYSGLDVRDGAARKRSKGEAANWNKVLRMTCVRKMTDQFIKLRGCYGRKLYDEYKAFYAGRDGDDLSKGHIDNRARRKVAKVFLSCLWVAWRQIKGLDVSMPYAFEQLPNHTHIVSPEDWLEGNGNGMTWTEDIFDLDG